METIFQAVPPALAGGFTPRADPKDFFGNLEALRVDYGAIAVGANEVVTKIPVRKPTRQEFFRTRLDEGWTLVTRLYEDKETREFYAIAPGMVGTIQALGEVTIAKLVPTVTRQGVTMINPVKLPSEGSAMTGWHETMLAAIQSAGSEWVRLSADMALGGYRVYQAKGDLGEPNFPDMSLNEMLEIGFRGRIIDSDDHPVVKKLSGRI